VLLSWPAVVAGEIGGTAMLAILLSFSWPDVEARWKIIARRRPLLAFLAIVVSDAVVFPVPCSSWLPRWWHYELGSASLRHRVLIRWSFFPAAYR
jgi:hypothetical protein